MTKKRKPSKSSDAHLLASATLAVFFFGYLNFVCWTGDSSKPTPITVAMMQEDTKPVHLKPLTKAVAKASRSEQIVAWAALEPACRADDWICPLQKPKHVLNSKGEIAHDNHQPGVRR